MSHLPRLLTQRILATSSSPPCFASTRIVCTCHQARTSATSFSTFASSWKAREGDRQRQSDDEGGQRQRWTKPLNGTRSRLGARTTGGTPSAAVRKPFDRSSTLTTSAPPRSPSGARSPAPLIPPFSTSETGPKDPPLWLKHRQAMRERYPLGWAPPKRISREAMDLVRTMHASDPIRYSTRVLSDHFKISPEAVRRILKSRFSLDVEERERREKKRKEVKALERSKAVQAGTMGVGTGGVEMGWRGDLVGEVKEIQELRQKNAVLEAGFEEKRRVRRDEGKRTGVARSRNEQRGAPARSGTRRPR
ncbi:BQ5605_C001g00158 [Microbotryum silenes-dioicae]|uniref:Required for respiratory growth protein 9, mitochondrial n=1 Tax=Microbotryum silenes-dioicae TaxID=796604 RepID=A0A2X0M6H4_9BASI|nr:BQ5605_C001g00158 [Microbotryum silenes-dioicae]